MKKLKIEEFIEILLNLKKKLEEDFIKHFKEWGSKLSEDELGIEASILALWIITLSVPYKKHRDLLHNAFCKELGLDEETKNYFLKKVSIRYKEYFDAFNKWSRNHQAGFWLGGTIVKFAKGEDETSLDALKSFLAFSLFSASFKATMNMIIDLKKEYEIEGFKNHKIK